MYKTQFSVSWPGDGDPRFPLFMSFLKACGRMFQVETWWCSPGKAIDEITSLQQNSQLDLEAFKVSWSCYGGDPVIYVRLAAPKSKYLKCSFNVDLWDRDISWDLEGITALIELTNPFEASIWHPDNSDALKSRITCAFNREKVVFIRPVHFFDNAFLNRYGIGFEQFQGYKCRKLQNGMLFYLENFFEGFAPLQIDAQFSASSAIHECIKRRSFDQTS